MNTSLRVRMSMAEGTHGKVKYELVLRLEIKLSGYTVQLQTLQRLQNDDMMARAAEVNACTYFSEI